MIESPLGPALVYDYAPATWSGHVLTAELTRGRPTTASPTFRPGQQLSHFDSIISVHQQLAKVAWVASDFYDGCTIVDFSTNKLTLIDLDTYQRGAGVKTMRRMFGATRFMAPEEFRLGATIDQRATVYTLGRLVWHFATRLAEDAGQFCGPDPVRAVVRQATNTESRDRFATVDHLASTWHQARTEHHQQPDARA